MAPRSILAILLTATWAAAMAGLALIQTYNHYSPVPVWDMWTGYLDFYTKTQDGDWAAWWRPHYEHRIPLARLMFWADLHWFNGENIFILFFNYVDLLLLILVFYKIIRDRLPDAESSAPRLILALFTGAWLFLSCQGENLTWAFQIEFFLAFLFPLYGMYCLNKFTHDARITTFAIACLCGVLSAGTLANGVVVLPLMVAYALFTRQRPAQLATLATLSLLVISIYFHNYQSAAHTLSMADSIRNFGKLLSFAFTLTGSPFYYIFNISSYRELVAQAFGLFFIIGFLYKAFKAATLRRSDPLQAVLLFFILYILISVAATTIGRFSLGIEAAIAPHHTTPAVVGWAAIIVLFGTEMSRPGIVWREWLFWPGFLLATLMASYQARSIDNLDEPLFDRRVTALGLSLGAIDDEKLQTLTDPVEFREIPPIAEKAYLRHLSVFGMYPFLGAREALGQEISLTPLPACTAAFDSVEPSNDKRFSRIRGGLDIAVGSPKPEIVRLISGDGRALGLALVGLKPQNFAGSSSGTLSFIFQGYVLSSAIATNQEITIRIENRSGPICSAKAPAPQLVYSIKPAGPVPDDTTLSSAEVAVGNQWTGGDFFHTDICGLKVYGSLVKDASDIGSISLNMKRGDRVLYRSGPSGGHQTVEITGHSRMALPDAEQWIVLDFSSADLPQDGFVAKFTDNGSGWGEWSAIAVRENRSCGTGRQ